MDVNEWITYECSCEGTHTQNIHYSSTRSHASEEENRTRNRSENCKCKRVYTQIYLCIAVAASWYFTKHSLSRLKDAIVSILANDSSITWKKCAVQLQRILVFFCNFGKCSTRESHARVTRERTRCMKHVLYELDSRRHAQFTSFATFYIFILVFIFFI